MTNYQLEENSDSHQHQSHHVLGLPQAMNIQPGLENVSSMGQPGNIVKIIKPRRKLKNPQDDVKNRNNNQDEQPKVKKQRQRQPKTLKTERIKDKKKVPACVFCKRSHITCNRTSLDTVCSNCVKRNIAHLCTGLHSHQQQQQQMAQSQVYVDSEVPGMANSHIPNNLLTASTASNNPTTESNTNNSMTAMQNNSVQAKSIKTDSMDQFTLFSDQLALMNSLGSEFTSLNNFLNMVENDPLPVSSMSTTPLGTTVTPQEGNIGGTQVSPEQSSVPTVLDGTTMPEQAVSTDDINITQAPQSYIPSTNGGNQEPLTNTNANTNSTNEINSGTLATSKNKDTQSQKGLTARENFLFTAVAPTSNVDSESRLRQVINAKLEAGLLTPYNYAKGYDRLQSYMTENMDFAAQQRILQPLSIIRPTFRAVARCLDDVDLLVVEESFERLLLSYDRVFSSLTTPAILWRRTGEIYRGNEGFANLVGCDMDELRDGKMAIFELLDNESCVNYWEKFCSVAFYKGAKSVLMPNCVLKNTNIKCSFSFTIKRDIYNIPTCIIGNFLPW